MITLPLSIRQQLEKMAMDGPLIYLAEIHDPDHLTEEYIRLARNTEDIVWDGVTWGKAWFEFDVVEESADGTQEIWIYTSNIAGEIEDKILDHNNFEESTLTLYCINTYLLTETTPIMSVTWDIAKPKCDNLVAALKLSMTNPFLQSYPAWLIHGSLCQVTKFPTDARCGYAGGVYTTCGRTLDDCIARFGESNVRMSACLGLAGETQDV